MYKCITSKQELEQHSRFGTGVIYMLILLRSELLERLGNARLFLQRLEEEYLVQEDVMGVVLEFRPKETSGGQVDGSNASAEVFIFPGVRIERRSFSLADRLYSPPNPARQTKQSGQKSKE